jgi:tripartite-type tricarboxylate transporter receptor subunit TctC
MNARKRLRPRQVPQACADTGVMRRFGRTLAAWAMASLACAAAAQDIYPQKPLRIIVGFQPGSSSDVAARIVAQKLGPVIGQKVVVENRAGASSGIAARAVAAAPPDGHVLFFATVANVINTAANSPTDVDLARDLLPVALIGRVPNILVLHPDLGITSLEGLIRRLKYQPDHIAYGTAGNGTALHMAAALFSAMADVRMLHVPYQGSAAAVTDLLAGRIWLMFAPASSVMPYVRAGRLTAIASTGSLRASSAPQLPTIAELGLKGFESSVWFGIAAPPGLPARTESILVSALREAVASEEVQAQFRSNGIETSILNLGDFAAYIRAETAKWAQVIQSQGIRLF